MEELWKEIPLDTRYAVSTYGRIRCVRTGKIRKTPIKQNGYYGLVFTYPGAKPRGYDLHYLVSLTWLGPRPEGFDISHQDGNKLNNCVANLKYESRKENANKFFNKFGNGLHVLTDELVKAIRKDRLMTNNQWAAKLNVTRNTIWKVRKRMTWKHL